MGIESTRITSESLQAAIRQLLPSQVGFGDDLHATNLIQPVIDLTATAEGSGLDVSLSQALAHGSISSFAVSNTTTTIINNTGFFRIFGGFSSSTAGGATKTANFAITDGTTSKIMYGFEINSTSANEAAIQSYDFVVFCRNGDSVTATSNDSVVRLIGSTRQLATVTGTTVNPVGFTAE